MPHVWAILLGWAGADAYCPRVGFATVAGMNPPLVIAVFAGKGGIGKTTTAINLAWLWAAAGLRVLLVDANALQRSAETLYDAWQHKLGHVPFDLTVEDRPELLGGIKQVPYDVVVIDCPPSPDESKAALDVADLIVVPYVPKPMETQAIMKTIRETLTGLRYVVLFNMVKTHRDGELRGRAEQAKEAMVGQGVPVLDAFVRDYAAHQTVVARQVPIFSEQGRALAHGDDGASDFEAVHGELQRLVAA